MAKRDIVIVGAGVNGLVAATCLARAGHKPLVVERRAIVGGTTTTEEFHPGFRCSPIASHAEPLLPEISGELQLERQGLSFIQPEVAVFAPSEDGRGLALFADVGKSADGVAKWSKRDAERLREFAQVLARAGKLTRRLLTLIPPDISSPGAADLWNLLKAGRTLRGLGKKEMLRLLRWGPMCAADLVEEWFETDLLRAVIAARGIYGAAMGPRSAGTAAQLLLRAALDPHPAGRTSLPRGGMGAIAEALANAARAAGAEIRTGTEVAEVRVKDGTIAGIALANGEEIGAKAVVSSADPKRTLLKLTDPVHLGPGFLAKMQNYRSNGSVAMVHLALGALPKFSGLPEGDVRYLAGRIHIGPGIDALEKAFDASKYGAFSAEPYMDAAIPTLTDPSLAPEGQHVMSIHAQYAPFGLKAGWEAQREALGDAVIGTLARYAPDLPERILARRVLTPRDLEETYGLTGGHIFHGELGLDQLFTMRPLLGWGRYRTPITGLYLCGAGTHPGAGALGASGYNAAREIHKDLKGK